MAIGTPSHLQSHGDAVDEATTQSALAAADAREQDTRSTQIPAPSTPERVGRLHFGPPPPALEPRSVPCLSPRTPRWLRTAEAVLQSSPSAALQSSPLTRLSSDVTTPRSDASTPRPDGARALEGTGGPGGEPDDLPQWLRSAGDWLAQPQSARRRSESGLAGRARVAQGAGEAREDESAAWDGDATAPTWMGVGSTGGVAGPVTSLFPERDGLVPEPDAAEEELAPPPPPSPPRPASLSLPPESRARDELPPKRRRVSAKRFAPAGNSAEMEAGIGSSAVGEARLAAAAGLAEDFVTRGSRDSADQPTSTALPILTAFPVPTRTAPILTPTVKSTALPVRTPSALTTEPIAQPRHPQSGAAEERRAGAGDAAHRWEKGADARAGGGGSGGAGGCGGGGYGGVGGSGDGGGDGGVGGGNGGGVAGAEEELAELTPPSPCSVAVGRAAVQHAARQAQARQERRAAAAGVSAQEDAAAGAAEAVWAEAVAVEVVSAEAELPRRAVPGVEEAPSGAWNGGSRSARDAVVRVQRVARGVRVRRALDSLRRASALLLGSRRWALVQAIQTERRRRADDAAAPPRGQNAPLLLSQLVRNYDSLLWQARRDLLGRASWLAPSRAAPTRRLLLSTARLAAVLLLQRRRRALAAAQPAAAVAPASIAAIFAAALPAPIRPLALPQSVVRDDASRHGGGDGGGGDGDGGTGGGGAGAREEECSLAAAPALPLHDIARASSIPSTALVLHDPHQAALRSAAASTALALVGGTPDAPLRRCSSGFIGHGTGAGAGGGSFGRDGREGASLGHGAGAGASIGHGAGAGAGIACVIPAGEETDEACASAWVAWWRDAGPVRVGEPRRAVELEHVFYSAEDELALARVAAFPKAAGTLPETPAVEAMERGPGGGARGGEG